MLSHSSETTRTIFIKFHAHIGSVWESAKTYFSLPQNVFFFAYFFIYDKATFARSGSLIYICIIVQNKLHTIHIFGLLKACRYCTIVINCLDSIILKFVVKIKTFFFSLTHTHTHTLTHTHIHKVFLVFKELPCCESLFIRLIPGYNEDFYSTNTPFHFTKRFENFTHINPIYLFLTRLNI